ncbi:Uncharacterized protein QTN25_001968 [Entamoeba marina]
MKTSPKPPRQPSRPKHSKSSDPTLHDLVTSLSTTSQPLPLLTQILHHITTSPPPASSYPPLLSTFHRFTTPLTTPLPSQLLHNAYYITAILAAIAIHRPSSLDLLTPLPHYAQLLPQLLSPVETAPQSLLSLLSTDTTSSILPSIHAEMSTLVTMPDCKHTITYCALLVLSHLNVIVSLPSLNALKVNSDDSKIIIEPYSTVLARGSTQPFHIVDDLRTPLHVALQLLPSTTSLMSVLTAIMNYSNTQHSDALLAAPISDALTLINMNNINTDDCFDVRVLQLSIAANALFELKKSAQVVVRTKVLESCCEEFLNLGNQKEELILKGYLALVICGVVYVDQSAISRVNMDWNVVLSILEEFAAFQCNCGALDETGKKRLVDAMEVIEGIIDSKTTPAQSPKKPVTPPLDDQDRKSDSKKTQRMSFDSFSLNEIDCY